ncbi:hypothetical protein [Streptomyces sp. NPDC059008]|uniref:hypothetical protein n=1 Tax=Streptomyces sp. NPDC059008 TaxID=3346693 RepID=UPI00367745BF
MGWTVLYIAFGLVALWLLGEVLLQYKARLRWRLLAFTGFLGVVVGVIIPSVIVIGVGLGAFAVGQVNVTLSFKRGFTTGWALGGKPGASRRRRGRAAGAPAAEPTLQISDLEAATPTDGPGGGADGGPDTFESTGGFRSTGGFQSQDTYAGQGSYDYQADGYPADGGYRGQDPYQDPQDQSVFATQAFPAPSYDGPSYGAQQYDGQGDYARADAGTVYAPQPMPDETGQYGIYSPDARTPQPGYSGYDAYGTTADSGNNDGNGYAYGGGYGQTAAGQDAYADPYAAYGDGSGQGQAPYSDPYTGAQQYSGGSYDPYEQQDPYAQPSYGAQQYDGQGGQSGQNADQGYGGTPPGGAWVPQQRDSELPPEQPPYPPYQQQGYDGQQYRY